MVGLSLNTGVLLFWLIEGLSLSLLSEYRGVTLFANGRVIPEYRGLTLLADGRFIPVVTF